MIENALIRMAESCQSIFLHWGEEKGGMSEIMERIEKKENRKPTRKGIL